MNRKGPISMEHAARMCPNCGGGSIVRRSGELPDGSILRRRICRVCGMRFETVEKFWRVVDIPGKGCGFVP